MIVEIDGKQVMGMSLSDAIEKLRGIVGTEIILTVIRKDAKEPLKFKIIRDVIQIQSVKHRVENGNIGYIRVSAFNSQTFPGLKKAFAEIEKEAGSKLIGYVLDLRNNPGGLLDQGIAVSDAFLEKGEIVSTRGRNPEDIRRDNAGPGDMAKGLPVVVVINGGSASASEIVAGALQDHKRAVIIGTQSFGKGSVQTLFDAPGGGSIKLTTARYFTPSGKSIQGKGITPDIIVERAKVVVEKENPFEVHEADLTGSLSNPDPSDEPADPTLLPDAKKDKNEKAPELSEKEKKAEEDRKSDYQLIRAIDILQGISIYNGKETMPAETKKTDTGTQKKTP
jgi:carboxyl-terminal processing protease